MSITNEHVLAHLVGIKKDLENMPNREELQQVKSDILTGVDASVQKLAQDVELIKQKIGLVD